MSKNLSDHSTPNSQTQVVAPEPNDTIPQVLARKYRPKNFNELLGQESMVQVLRNSFLLNRIAHGYILTGVRGVGKTTTARIIAKALNCEKNKNKYQSDPCGLCEQCIAISQYRHIDVQELDAASHNKVDDVRAIIENVGYRPVLGKYRVYILDEAHMITNQAFNALLKTLEEPPPHLVFILATTEVEKLPTTIVSRCMRFDLQRLPIEKLIQHFEKIATSEKINFDKESLHLVARAAEGSVRDGLSILDQAIALNPDGLNAKDIMRMLGLSDKDKIFQLFSELMAGNAQHTLNHYQTLITFGASPDMLLTELMGIVHLVAKIALDKNYAQSPALTEIEKLEGLRLADLLPLPILARTWQMLLKGLEELRISPDPILAAEMILMRLLLVADKPTPQDLLQQLSNNSLDKSALSKKSLNNGSADAVAENIPNYVATEIPSTTTIASPKTEQIEAVITKNPTTGTNPSSTPNNLMFEQWVEKIATRNFALGMEIRQFVKPVLFQQPSADKNIGILQYETITDPDARTDLATAITQFMKQDFAEHWQIAAVKQKGTETIDNIIRKRILNQPEIQQLLHLFPETEFFEPYQLRKKQLKTETIKNHTANNQQEIKPQHV